MFAISKSPAKVQLFLRYSQVILENTGALEHGLGGVVLKAEDVKVVLDLKEYFDRRNEVHSRLSLTKATLTRVLAVGIGDRVCIDLCSLMRPGEGLLAIQASTIMEKLAALLFPDLGQTPNATL
ncbi:hypothetical protein F3Y22_tig00110548pilonHSYRG00023 [Hibiscus syriacus]|uniref:3-dehydroquinate synthase C-terminal domain-containing protein n=1 Tax=Hibiscus syriacus TaxID=106335 RepID=A0A6A3A9B0_HIBSY|nr:hypothetical protein F3Y22_tig00110548pilonHSYRG00023 [Hibiscus syriacus]